MCDTSRFTPLYIIKMMLDIKYENKNIIIPEVLLELVSGLEEQLRRDLGKINFIAGSDPEKLIEYIKNNDLIIDEFAVSRGYAELRWVLLCSSCASNEICNDLSTFLAYVKHPLIINQDVIRDLIPVTPMIMFGCNYETRDILANIFRYMIYLKTKDSPCFGKNKIIFKSIASIPREIFFNY